MLETKKMFNWYLISITIYTTMNSGQFIEFQTVLRSQFKYTSRKDQNAFRMKMAFTPAIIPSHSVQLFPIDLHKLYAQEKPKTTLNETS